MQRPGLNTARASTGPGQNSDLRPFSCQFTPEFSSELGTYAPILPPDPARTSGMIYRGPALPRGRPGPPSSIIQNSSFGSPSADHFQPSGSSQPSCHGLRSAPGSSPEACLEFSGATNVTHLSCLSRRSFSIQTLLSRFRYRFPSCHLVTLRRKKSCISHKLPKLDTTFTRLLHCFHDGYMTKYQFFDWA